MSDLRMPRYPVYVPSKERSTTCLTAQFLIRDGVPFHLVVEPSQVDAYRKVFPDQSILVLPRDGMRLLGSRLWIREHSIAAGFDRHWQLDDNLRCVMRLYRGRRIRANSGIALRCVEDFSDRYTNIGVSGMNYTMFVPNNHPTPYWLNCHVYSCSLINNRMPHKWRLLYNDDTDLCLQVLASGMCTVAVSVFSIQKVRTGIIKGGNTDDLYRDDGRLTMAKSLERMWPGVVVTKRRFQRPQHVIVKSWRQFDQQLIRRTDIDWSAIEQNRIDEYGLSLMKLKPIESAALQRWWNRHGKPE